MFLYWVSVDLLIAVGFSIVVIMSYDIVGCMMMGVTGTAAVERLEPYGLAGIGANCGNNIPDTEAAVLEIKRLLPDTPVVSKANAGIPEWHGTELHYNGTPEVLANHAHRIRAAGIEAIGGCCGSTPDHIELVAKVFAGEVPVPEVEVEAATGAAPQREERQRRRRRRSAS